MSDLTPEIQRLLEWVPTMQLYSRIFRELDTNFGEALPFGMYEEGDENAPFVSEKFAYNLLGKEDARTLRALLRQALVSLGVDDMELRRAGL